jgi:hypothetical protein
LLSLNNKRSIGVRLYDLLAKVQACGQRRGAQMDGWLKLVQAWLPVLTVVVGALWGLYTYIDHQKEVASAARDQQRQQTAARLLEAQRPFLEKQLALYFDAAQVAGKLTTLKPGNADWDNNENRFWQLYWSELSLVESPAVETAMVKVGQYLNEYKKSPNNNEAGNNLQGSIYELAHAIRDGIQATWTRKPE